MSSKYFKTVAIILFIASVFAVVVHVDSLVPKSDTIGEDIYYSWLEGKRILSGENPYERILSGDMRTNQKYPTYFPLFYLLSYATQLFGLTEYPEWISFWQIIFLLFHMGVGLTLFFAFYRRGSVILALFASLFWLFSRWNLHVIQIAHLDFPPIFFLVVSLLTFNEHRWGSLVLFSTSLALKQIAIFLIPLYLIWVWQRSEENAVKNVFVASIVIVSIPAVSSIPFLLWNAEAFLKSILFSATRFPAGHFGVPSLDVMLSLVGIPARIPMLCLMALICFAFFQRKIGMYTSVLFTMFVFIDFNSVLFRQYMSWVVPLIPLAVCDVIPRQRLEQELGESVEGSSQ